MGIRLFRPVVAEGFEWVQPVDKGDFDSVYQLEGTPIAGRWKPIRVRRLDVDEQGKPLRVADLPWLGGHALVFRDRAYRAFSQMLSGHGEFLPLDLVDGTDRLWLLNVCRVIDALDEEASKMVRFPSSGRVMKIKQHVFSPERIIGQRAFRVPQVRTLFLDEEVVMAMTAAKLSGATFELVWEEVAAASGSAKG
jgi:Immunity protein family (Imm11)